VTQRNRWRLVCLLLVNTAWGCSSTTIPQPTKSPQAITTPKPTTAPIAGWKKIAGNGVTLSLPDNYDGGNPSQDIDAISQKLKTISPEYGKRIEALKQHPSNIALLAFDPQSAKSGFLTNVNITTEQLPQGTTVEQTVDNIGKQFATNYVVLDQKIVLLDQDQAGRIVAEATASGKAIKQLSYVIQKDNRVWLVTYATSASEFEQRLPGFEKSVRTFTLPS
jgi:hypothetical protein